MGHNVGEITHTRYKKMIASTIGRCFVFVCVLGALCEYATCECCALHYIIHIKYTYMRHTHFPEIPRAYVQKLLWMRRQRAQAAKNINKPNTHVHSCTVCSENYLRMDKKHAHKQTHTLRYLRKFRRSAA